MSSKKDNKKESHTNSFFKKYGKFFIRLPLLGAMGWNTISDQVKASFNTKKIIYSEFVNDIRTGKISDVILDDRSASGHFKANAKANKDEPSSFSVALPAKTDIAKDLIDHGVKVVAAEKHQSLSDIIFIASNILFLGGLFFLYGNRLQGGPKKAAVTKPKVRFDDVQGIDEAKAELSDIVDFLQHKEKYENKGAHVPHGVLMVGQPGTGKTFLAQAVAAEASVPFFSVSGSEFVELFVGNGARRVRSLFKKARKNAPCVLFIDELDAIGKKRTVVLTGGTGEMDQTLNQILTEMDGFDKDSGVIVLAATNRSDVLDPALMRAGRFDRKVFVPLPDMRGREAILRVHTKNVPLSDGVDLTQIARATTGFSGADLAALANEAALIATREETNKVEPSAFDKAIDKITMGQERKGIVISERQKKIAAIHEAGHALTALETQGTESLRSVSIIPRGNAIGATVSYPGQDSFLQTKEELDATLVKLAGGRAAERLVLGDGSMTTGAANDIEKATKLARAMAGRFGMSDKIGFIALESDTQEAPLASPATLRALDTATRKILDEAQTRAKEILTRNRGALEAIAQCLVERETLSGKEVTEIYTQGKIPAPV